MLTHGWVVDGKGEAMHKSKGNSVYPDDMVKKYGADIVRLWVASADYRMDVRCSDLIFKQLSEAYRKIRNTSRILLANLGDFDPNTDIVPIGEMTDIDKWIISRANRFVTAALESYDKYEFHVICQALNNFCTTDLSKLYIDITKDRVYVEDANSPARRSAQSAMYIVLSMMTRTIAPILSFTADEIWKAMPHLDSDDARNIMLNSMPTSDDNLSFPEIEEKFERLFELRDTVMKALELARNDKKIGKSLDAKLTVFADGDTADYLCGFGDDLKNIFIVSAVSVKTDAPVEGAYSEEESEISVLVENADGRKCDRCWSYSEDGVSDEDGFVCKRCAKILGL